MSNTFERWGETILGAAVVIVAVGFFAFAAAQAGQTTGAGGRYDLIARFQRVDGVNVGTDVLVSGVKVGVVRDVSLDTDTYMARLTLSIDNGVEILDESNARIVSGLLGGSSVSIEPAGMEVLPAGGEIPYTQGAIDFLSVLSSFAPSGNQSDSSEAQTP